MKAVRRLGGWVLGVSSIVCLTVYPANRLSGQDSFPSRPPRPTPLRPVRFPPFQEELLPSGMRLVLIENHEQPVVSVTLSFRAGDIYDPEGKEGLADLTGELLTKGTASRTADRIAAQIEGVGGSLSASSDADFLTVATDVLSDHADLAFELLGDVTRHATYPADELELARTRALSGLQLELSQPASIANRMFLKEIYGPSPYGRRPVAASVRSITRDDVVRFAGQRLRPGGALLVIAGDVTRARALELARAAFGGWTGSLVAAASPPAPPTKAGTDILLVNRPGSVQANIVIGNTTFPPASPTYYSARVATQVLGGGADARLFLILREQKSWTYGAYASLRRNRGTGYWQATFEGRTQVADSALGELLHQIDRMRTEVVPDTELKNAVNFLVGSFPLTIETPEQIAQVVTQAKLLGLAPDYIQTYRERLSAVTPRAARTAAQTVYRRQALTIVVVGDAAALYDKLSAIAPVRIVDVDGKPLTAAALHPQVTPVTVDPSQVSVGTDSFQVLVQGNVFGSQVATLQRAGDSLVFTERTVLGPALSQQSTVVLDPTTLAPWRVEQTGSAGGQPAEVHLTYANGRVKGRATSPQRTGTPKTVDVDTTVAAGTFDDNQLHVVLPALPLAEGRSFALNVFSSGEGVVKILTVKVAGVENVTVPAGTFPTYRLELSGLQLPVVMHVTRDLPRRLVRIEPVGAPLVFELVK
jgi:zinc protease